MSSGRELGRTYAQVAKGDTGTGRATGQSTIPPFNPVRRQSEIAREKEANVQQSSSESGVTYAQVLKGIKSPDSRSGKDRGEPTDESRISENPSYMQTFRAFLQANKKPTIEQIIKLVPLDATGWKISYEEAPDAAGFKYTWLDLKNLKEDICNRRGKAINRRRWEVYVRNPNPQSPEGSNSRDWILRIKMTEYYIGGGDVGFFMDLDGNFHVWSSALPNARNSTDDAIKKTHIIIQTPEQYISPIDKPEHYGQQK